MPTLHPFWLQMKFHIHLLYFLSIWTFFNDILSFLTQKSLQLFGLFKFIIVLKRLCNIEINLFWEVRKYKNCSISTINKNLQMLLVCNLTLCAKPNVDILKLNIFTLFLFFRNQMKWFFLLSENQRWVPIIQSVIVYTFTV